jgi:isoleucyl-tRNA synthetase
MYRTLRSTKDPQSVHLCNYPKYKPLSASDKKLLEKMALVRTLSSAVHTLRAEAQQPLRQRMATVILGGTKSIKADKELTKLFQDEVNTECIKFDTKPGKNFISTKVSGITVCLDKKLTEKLIAEGLLRELMRGLQDARKKAGLNVGQEVDLIYNTDSPELFDLINRETSYIKRAGYFGEITKNNISQGEKLFKGSLTIAIDK